MKLIPLLTLLILVISCGAGDIPDSFDLNVNVTGLPETVETVVVSERVELDRYRFAIPSDEDLKYQIGEATGDITGGELLINHITGEWEGTLEYGDQLTEKINSENDRESSATITKHEYAVTEKGLIVTLAYYFDYDGFTRVSTIHYTRL